MASRTLRVIRGGPRLGDERAAGSSRKCPNIHSRLDGRPQSGPARRPLYHARSIQLRRSLCPCQLCGWVRLNTPRLPASTVFPLPGLRLPPEGPYAVARSIQLRRSLCPCIVRLGKAQHCFRVHRMQSCLIHKPRYDEKEHRLSLAWFAAAAGTEGSARSCG